MSSNSKFYWKMAQRRMPAMAALFLLCTGLAVALAIKLPTTYSATARLLVEPPQISGMETLVVDDLAQLQIIEQRLMVRANMIDVADRRRVFPNRGSMSADGIVEAMRGKTEIETSSGRNQATLMAISFDAGEAKTASDVVNDFVTLILQDNVRIRTGRAEDTLAFFNQEIERLSVDLDLQSEKILAFKAENSDALPEDQPYRLTRLGDLQERIARIERDIAGQNQRRDSIMSVYEATGSLQSQSSAALTPDQRQLQGLQGELSAALVTFSEENPRVKVLKGRIAALEAKISAQAGVDVADTNDPNAQQNAILQINLAEIDGAVDNLRTELVQANAELSRLRDAIERTPANQIALEALERDYDNLQTQYNAAVERGNQARMGERIELGSKGQRITVIEQATVPNQPSSPNRPLISIAGVAAGLGMAGGLFFLLEFLNRTARRPVELTNALGITPLATIPYMEDERHKLLRRSRLVASFLIVVIGMPAALWAIDTFYLPLDLIVERIIEKLGLG